MKTESAARGLSLVLFAFAATAQPAPFTLDDVLGFSFPTELSASPGGGKIAWVSNTRGVRNVLIAEAPDYRPRRLTNYANDDGQEIQQLRWLPDGSGVLYVRGGTANPALDPHGVTEDIWLVRAGGTAPVHIAQGASPAVAPAGDRIAFVLGRQIWFASLDGKTNPQPAFRARGGCTNPLWSPDGRFLAFTSDRGDHALIGVYDIAGGTLRYLDPSSDFDSDPVWSPDSRAVAFLRLPSSGLRPVRQAERAGQPWSIRVASIDSGVGRQLWRATEGPGSVYRPIVAASQLQWTTNGRIVFAWEGDGWTHLYSVADDGGRAAALTPGAFEVEHVALAANRRDVIFSSNQGYIDRRHLWRVAAAGGVPAPLTTGNGIEVSPAPVGGDAIAFLGSGAKEPLHPALLEAGHTRDLEAIPPAFPTARMVAPQQVVFSAADGLSIHGQLFLPPGRAGVRSPAIVFFHGGPRRQMLLGWHYMYYYANAYALNQFLANSGYVVLSVNFRSGIGYGLNFREALHYGASGGSEYNDVQGAGVYLRSRADVDPARIGVWGGSYGGYLTAMALARASDLYKTGVDFHGVHNWATELGIPATEPDYRIAFESSPLFFVKEWRSPVLLIQGDDDPDVQFNQTVRLAFALRQQKVDVEELVLPDEVHDFLLYRSWRDAYRATVDFFKRKL